MTTKELMAFLNLSRTKIWELVTKQDLPAFKIGGDYRYRRSEVLVWMEKYRSDAVAVATGDEQHGPAVAADGCRARYNRRRGDAGTTSRRECRPRSRLRFVPNRKRRAIAVLLVVWKRIVKSRATEDG